MVVHFIVVEGDVVRPLCGDWARSPNWTRLTAAVTCPRCLALLEAARRGAEPPAAQR